MIGKRAAAALAMAAACAAEPGSRTREPVPRSSPAPRPPARVDAGQEASVGPADAGTISTPPPPPEIFSYGLGAPEADCTLDRLLARLGDCRRVPAVSELTALADGDACTGVTVAAEDLATVRFDRPRALSGVVVVAGKVDREAALRVLEVEVESGWVTHSRLPAPLFAQRAFAGVFVEERELEVRALRLRATHGATEWLEIAPFHCEGNVRSPLDTGADRRFVPGSGSCRRDADCVPASCCHAQTCVHRRLAPACQGVGCPEHCPTDSVQCRGSCACIEGRCGATFPKSGPDKNRPPLRR
jgi:hypothetical protein